MTRYGLIFLLYGLIVSAVGGGLSIAAILFATFILSLPAAFVARLTAEGRL